MIANCIEFPVEFGETDTAGIVFYPNYFRWFDRATHTLLNITGLTHRELLEKYHYAQPVIECGCQFVRPLRYNDPVKIESRLVEVREHLFRVEHVVYSRDCLVGSGYEVRAWIKTDETDEQGRLKVISIPPDMAEKLRGEAISEGELVPLN
jgi:acyl-CoA thioester hydrolase